MRLSQNRVTIVDHAQVVGSFVIDPILSTLNCAACLHEIVSKYKDERRRILLDFVLEK